MNIPEHFLNQSSLDLYGSASKGFQLGKVFQHQNKNQYFPEQPQSDLGSDIAISQLKELNTPFTYEENFKTILEGWIKKKTLNSSFQQRYFVLTPTRLCYFLDEKKTELKGCFNFISLLKYNLIIGTSELQVKLKLSPAINTEQFRDRFIIQLQFSTKNKQNQWFNQISNIIKQLNFKHEIIGKEMLSFYPQIPIELLIQTNQKFVSQYNSNFWNSLDISVPELFAYASHLDILLMRSKNPVSYLSRFFMRSYYDHVALLIKSQLHEVFVFEAIESRGVSVIDLQTFLKINQQDYEEIAFRKLLVKQTLQEEQEGFYKGIPLQKLQSYLNGLLGKKYELSLAKLLFNDSEYDVSKDSVLQFCETRRTFSKQNKSPEQIEMEASRRQFSPSKQVEKTFFCSELIADIYLKFGLIREGRSRDFWPKDFQQNEIKFKQNASFSPIMKVSFR